MSETILNAKEDNPTTAVDDKSEDYMVTVLVLAYLENY